MITRLTIPPPPPRPKIIAFGPLQDLDPVDVVEVAEILDVVAHAIDEEVGGAAELPRSTICVAIALAAAVRSAGNEIQQIGDRAQLLVLDLLSETTVSAWGMSRMSVSVLVAVLVDLTPYCGRAGR